MTVNSSTQSVTYNGDGTTTVFPTTFYFLRNEDVHAALITDGGGTDLVYGADFELSGAGDTAGGTLTMVNAPATGYQLTIERRVPVTQQTEYQQNDPFPAKTTEKALDKLTMICQQLVNVLGSFVPENARALLLGRFDVNGSGSYRANGNRIQNLGAPRADTDAATLGTARDIAEEITSGAQGALGTFIQDGLDPAVRTFQNKMREVVSLTDYAGAVGDFNGTTGTDNSVFFVRARAISRELYIPKGNYLITTQAALDAIASSTCSGPGLIFYNNGTRIVQVGKYYRIGVNNNASNKTMPSGGFIVGGEGPGVDGVLMWGQQPSWMQVQTTKEGANTEFQVYTGAISGLATSVAGSNVINATYGDFSSTRIEVGDIIGWGNREYLIASKPSNTQLTLTYVDGSALVFGSSLSRGFRHCYAYAEGTCDVSGTAVTWRSGDLFFGIYDPYPQNWITISGTRYSVTFNDIMHVTLGSTGGVQSNVSFVQKMYQSNLAVLRLQGVAGGSEEAFAAYNTTYGDCLVETQYAGGGQYNALRFRTGPEYDYGYSRDHLNISADGRVGIGKAYVDPVIGFPTQAKVHIWRESQTAAATNGGNDLRMVTLDSQSVGTAPRQLAFGFRNNFNCGYIQGYQNKAGTIGGTIHLNPDGGNVKIGDGNTTFSPNTLSVGGIISHTIDNTYSFGSASYRCSQLFAGTAAINTSDEREKQQVRTLSDAERAVAVALKGLIRMFKYNDAVDKKGADARWHSGVVAQDVITAFSAHGLDAAQYGILCHDEWPDTYIEIPEEWEETEALDTSGKPIMRLVNPARRELATPAGDRYGVRYEELYAFIIASL